MSDTWLFFGLGNPGPQYATTPHNVGQMVITRLVERMNASLRAHPSRTLVCEGRLGTLPGGAPGPRIIAAQSTGYMNTSGQPLSALARYFHIEPERIVVIHDDLDLPAHVLKMKNSGGEGGHNGLKSISQCLGTRAYGRLRLGIGRPPGKMNPADYVLTPIPARARDEWAVTCELAADAVESIAIEGWVRAQMALHSRS